MSASNGDWWRDAFDAIDRVVNGSDTGIQLYPDEIRDALAAVLPLFVAEATRRIDGQRIKDVDGDLWAIGHNYAIRHDVDTLARLAWEVRP